jgi:hypothetical protein
MENDITISENMLDLLVDALVDLPYHRAAPVLDELNKELSGEEPTEAEPVIVTAH